MASFKIEHTGPLNTCIRYCLTFKTTWSVSVLATLVSHFLPPNVQQRCYSTLGTVTLALEPKATVDFCSIWLQLRSYSPFHTCSCTVSCVCMCAFLVLQCVQPGTPAGHALKLLADLPPASVVFSCCCSHYCCLSCRHISARPTLSHEPACARAQRRPRCVYCDWSQHKHNEI